jgi:hypothetical protein
MDDSEELVLPPSVEWKLEKVFVQDIDVRLRELTYLVALQETELALMWVTVLGLFGYILVKEHRGQRINRST